MRQQSRWSSTRTEPGSEGMEEEELSLRFCRRRHRGHGRRGASRSLEFWSRPSRNSQPYLVGRRRCSTARHTWRKGSPIVNTTKKILNRWCQEGNMTASKQSRVHLSASRSCRMSATGRVCSLVGAWRVSSCPLMESVRFDRRHLRPHSALPCHFGGAAGGVGIFQSFKS